MVASGFAGLGSQIAWTQQAAHWLGHDGLAVLAVVGAFFDIRLLVFAFGNLDAVAVIFMPPSNKAANRPSLRHRRFVLRKEIGVVLI